MNASELTRFLSTFDPRDAGQRGQLLYERHRVRRLPPNERPAAVVALLDAASQWAESIDDDPVPVAPRSPLDVQAPVEFRDGTPRRKTGWSDTDRQLVERLAGVDKLTDAEVKRLAQLFHTSDGDPSARALVERLVEPVRLQHVAAVQAHEAAVQQWAERRPKLPASLRSTAVKAVDQLLEGERPELDQRMREWHADQLIEHGGRVPEEAA